MKKEEILYKVDHTILNQVAKFEDIKRICDEGIKYNVASVCIPPSYVEEAKKYVEDKIKICTVIGFPNGYSTTDVKIFETKDALNKGADEIDMVINIGFLKDKKYDYIEKEVKAIKNVCGNKVLKVIIETCFLTEDEKIKMCEIIKNAGADYIKTSTGFGSNGATIEDIKLFKKELQGSNVKIKAAGGIKNFDDANDLIIAGADRLGTSKLIKILNE